MHQPKTLIITGIKVKSTVSFLLTFSRNVFNIELNSQLKYYFPVSYRLLLGTTEILNEKPEFP